MAAGAANAALWDDGAWDGSQAQGSPCLFLRYRSPPWEEAAKQGAIAS